MPDDIVTRLRRITAKPLGLVLDPPPHPLCKEAADEIERLRAQRDEARAEVDLKGSRLDDALDEIERLRSALALACGELSGYGPHTNSSPDHLMQELLKEARRG